MKVLAPELPPKPKERWSPEMRHAYDMLGPHAVYWAGTDGPVSLTIHDRDMGVKRRIGHNRGCWPVKIGTTRAWRDTVTPLLDKDPWVDFRVQGRVFLPRHDHAHKLAAQMTDVLAKAAERAGFEQLKHGYTDAGPNFKPEAFDKHVLDAARALGLLAWTEDGLSAFLAKAIAQARLKGIPVVDGRGRAFNHPAFRRLIDRLLEKEMARPSGVADASSVG